MTDEGLYTAFAAAIAGPDPEVDLFGAAMLIARLGGHHVDEHGTARELDLMAEAVLETASPADGAEALVDAINAELYGVRGFNGNAGQYNEPENSYLDRVVARRTGIPITLSLVYREVAERVGLRCDGVGFPGHFLVRCGDPSQNLYIDPFHGGARVPREELLARLRGASLGSASPESFLAAVTRRQILQRMLNNLHSLFRDHRDLERWLATVELLLRLEPWNGALVGERGMLHYRLGDPSLALVDLERYVSAANPGAVSSGALRLLDELRLLNKGSEGT